MITEKAEKTLQQHGETELTFTTDQSQGTVFSYSFYQAFFQAYAILKKEKPDCIISTGALMTYPVCLLGKMRKIHIIYIESFARVDEASLTGKLMYPLADLFLVQWEDMLKVFPKAIYAGGIF